MSKDNKYWVNNHNTNIVIINSGDGNYRIGAANENASPKRNAYTPSNKNADLKTILDFPSLEDSEDKSHHSAKEVSPDEVSIFQRSDTNKMKTKSHFGTEKEKKLGN